MNGSLAGNSLVHHVLSKLLEIQLQRFHAYVHYYKELLEKSRKSTDLILNAGTNMLESVSATDGGCEG
jgi:uncharacterized HAD superfamily protein